MDIPKREGQQRYFISLLNRKKYKKGVYARLGFKDKVIFSLMMRCADVSALDEIVSSFGNFYLLEESVQESKVHSSIELGSLSTAFSGKCSLGSSMMEACAC